MKRFRSLMTLAWVAIPAVAAADFGKDKKSLSGRSETFVGGVSTGIMKMKATK